MIDVSLQANVSRYEDGEEVAWEQLPRVSASIGPICCPDCQVPMNLAEIPTDISRTGSTTGITYKFWCERHGAWRVVLIVTDLHFDEREPDPKQPHRWQKVKVQ